MLTRQVRFSQLEGATLPTPRELLNAAKAEIREIDPHEVAERLESNREALQRRTTGS